MTGPGGPGNSVSPARDGGFAAELARYAQDLRALRIERGSPSYLVIGRRIPGRRQPQPSTLSEVFTGKRLPSWDTHAALVRALLSFDAHGQPIQPAREQADNWTQRWRILKGLQQQGTQPPRPPASGAAAHAAAVPQLPSPGGPRPSGDARPAAGRPRIHRAEPAAGAARQSPEPAPAWAELYQLSANPAFTESDKARIVMLDAAHRLSDEVWRLAQLVGLDQVQSGDYLHQLRQIAYSLAALADHVAYAESVRGTATGVIEDGLKTAGRLARLQEANVPERISKVWGRLTSRTTPLHLGRVLSRLDRWITQKDTLLDKEPLAQVLDAAAPWTGRDAAEADRQFLARQQPPPA
ncbi:hypothetical protein ABH931_002759 [Streptacidiphilus sp. MAP12-33]|uniref:hypothetical protein n=1 Tax=Streptacidiphilus sp. MAP12-33 TaxID=3156266 RepID=UPI00351219F5